MSGELAAPARRMYCRFRGNRKLDPSLQAWIDVRKRHHLSHAHVQMARELGMNPAKLGKIEELARMLAQKKEARRQAKAERHASQVALSAGGNADAAENDATGDED